jgi:hypothetical protein
MGSGSVEAGGRRIRQNILVAVQHTGGRQGRADRPGGRAQQQQRRHADAPAAVPQAHFAAAEQPAVVAVQLGDEGRPARLCYVSAVGATVLPVPPAIFSGCIMNANS